MTYTQEPKASDLDILGFYAALTATGKEYAAISWDGFNLWGNRQSVKEVERLIHKESFIKPLQDRINDQQNIIDKLKQKLSDAEITIEDHERLFALERERRTSGI